MISTVITPESLVPVGAAVAVVVALVTCTWWLANTLSSIKGAIDQINDRLNQVVRSDEFAEWRLELKNHNPSISVPPLRKD